MPDPIADLPRLPASLLEKTKTSADRIEIACGVLLGAALELADPENQKLARAAVVEILVEGGRPLPMIAETIRLIDSQPRSLSRRPRP